MTAAAGARRVHPASLVMATARSAWGLAAGGVALVVVALRGQLGWALAGIALGLAAASVLPWLRWWRFTYRIGAEALDVEEGILDRRRRSVPLGRIQDISIEQGLVARLLGIAIVRVETGGGQADDAVLDSVSLAEAHRLRELLGSARAETPGAAAGAHEPLFAMGLGRVLLHGLLSFSILAWAAVIVECGRRIGNWLNIEAEDLLGIAEHDVAPRLTLALAGAGLVFLVLVGMAVGMVRAILRDHGFRLFHADGRFRSIGGLMPHRETVIVDRRIQLALVRQNLLSRAFGWCALDFQTLGGSEGPAGRQQVAPLARPAEAARIVAVAGLPEFAEQQLAPVDRGHGLRLAIRRCVPLLLATAALAWFDPRAAWLLLLAAPVIALSWAAPRFHRFALADGALHMAAGVVGRRAWILPTAAVQTVTLRRGPIQRMLGLVTVAPDTAGAGGAHRPTVEDLPLEQGRALASALLEGGGDLVHKL